MSTFTAAFPARTPASSSPRRRTTSGFQPAARSPLPSQRRAPEPQTPDSEFADEAPVAWLRPCNRAPTHRPLLRRLHPSTFLQLVNLPPIIEVLSTIARDPQHPAQQIPQRINRRIRNPLRIP